MNDRTDTVLVKRNGGRGQHRINKSDYDPKTMSLVKEGPQEDLKDDETAVGGNTKNPSGTYSTPTPTDIRYPDKTKTEFENNLGAFVGRSAAQIREDEGMEDAPGGLDPDPALLEPPVAPDDQAKLDERRREREAREADEAKSKGAKRTAVSAADKAAAEKKS